MSPPLPLPLPFVDLQAQHARLAEPIEQALRKVLQHGRFVFGPEVESFEKRFAQFCNAEHVVACANGTDALQLALRVEGIGVGDAVFLPAFTFAATAGAIVLCGATPFFLDICQHDYALDPNSLARAVAEARALGLHPRAVIAVDLYGLPADYEALTHSAREQNLLLIADAAQSCGAKYKNRSVGSLADITTFSFFPTKPLGAYGDGGAIATHDAERARKLRMLANHGQTQRYQHQCLGTNSRLDSMQAAVLLVKLDALEQELAAREHAAQRYDRLLAEWVELPPRIPQRQSAWAQYTIASGARSAIAAACAARGVPTFIHYPRPLSAQPAYQSYPIVSGAVPCATHVSQRVLSLPMHADLTVETQSFIVGCVVEALKSPSSVAETRRWRGTATG